MTGSQIKDILEDVCDNLFNADPYYQQGGDMVRVGGFAYTCTPAEIGRPPDFRTEARQRPSARGRQELQGGRMGFGQRTAGQAGVGGLARHLRSGKPSEPRGAGVTLKGVDGNPGIDGTDEHFDGYRGAILRVPRQRRAGGVAGGADRLGAAPQPAPLPDKPFAEHRIVLQLSDNDPKKQGSGDQRRL